LWAAEIMLKISTPQDLRSELDRLVTLSKEAGVSREAMYQELEWLADRLDGVAATFNCGGIIAREAYPQVDLKGSGEWTAYFETDDPKTIHRWKFRTEHQAVTEAQKAQKEHGGYVTVMQKGLEKAEVGPGGKVTKNATVANVAARYVALRAQP
jgi:hypothetical protein